MICPICHKRMNGEPHDPRRDWNIHHYWFPRDNFRRSPKRRVKMPVHIACHNEFNWFMSHVCHTKIKCFGCKYEQVCCYYRL